MKIEEIGTLNLNEVIFKLSNNSITVRGKADNKTKGIINDIKKLSSLPSNKKLTVHNKYKVNLNPYSNELYVKDDTTLYYIIDQKHHEVALKLFNTGTKEEYNKLNEKIKKLTELNINVLFLNIA